MTQQQKFEKFSHKKIFFVILYLLSILYFLPLISSPVNVYDEGIILTGAERTQKREVPYSDFWTMVHPGQLYALSSVFNVFGTSVLVERLYDILIKSFIPLETAEKTGIL